MPTIRLPGIKLREKQIPFWRAMEQGARRAAPIWPRRFGKDTVSLAWTAFDAHRNVGNYWHLFPEQTQARKAIWNGVNKEGKRHIDVAFPPELREKTLDDEMLIRFKNGSTWQLGGSDRFDALVGSNPRGVVFSEYAISNPAAYRFVRPILAENGGWAIFPSTPRGRNHLFRLYGLLKADPQSFAELLTVEDTRHISEEALALEKQELDDEDEGLFEQEYYCSWDYGSQHAYFAKRLSRAWTEGRITSVPVDERYPVHASLDLGKADGTAVWFFQAMPGGHIHFVDYWYKTGIELIDIHKMLKEKGYAYGKNLILPHDGGHERLGMASIEDQLFDLGWPSVVLPVEKSVLPGINLARGAIGRAYFDEEKTEKGRDALLHYQKEWDDKRQVHKPTPLHDWSSHAADSFRYTVRAIDEGHCADVGWEPIDYSTLNRAAI